SKGKERYAEDIFRIAAVSNASKLRDVGNERGRVSPLVCAGFLLLEKESAEAISRDERLPGAAGDLHATASGTALDSNAAVGASLVWRVFLRVLRGLYCQCGDVVLHLPGSLSFRARGVFRAATFWPGDLPLGRTGVGPFELHERCLRSPRYPVAA